MTGSLVALVREGLLLALLLAAPLLVAALVAGIVTGLLGAFTQIQDPSIGLVPRIAAVGIALVLFMPAIGRQLEVFVARLWPMIVAAGARWMTLLVFALRGAAAVLVLTTLAGGLPRLVQLGLAVVIGVWSALLVGPPAVTDGLMWIAARELVIGATLGLVAVIPLLAAAMAGRLVDLVGHARGPYAGLFGVLAAAVFVGIDGHVTVVAAIADSHRAAPALLAIQPRAVDAIAGLIGAAVTLAIPWLVTAAIVEIAVGVGARLAARTSVFLPGATAVPAALVMITATLIATLAVAIAALVRGTL